ncbi:hypothetical protein E4U19_004306 [Claviceps sp. Clav32 group G5]|nr:hypothetical protein E4U19_004306 [Claviceps sp. Clav32 group G5]KAG6049807.1 hypothetical protein E4U39_005423 [Claviceps sp. Clav50 group G5]
MSTLKRFFVGRRIVLVVALILSMISPIECLGWRNSGEHNRKSPEGRFFASPVSLTDSPAASDAYALALIELQELESEPLCHRVAARLLVGNCQLLDGKNEASVLADTGRAARDFVDFFAASLAICDLERANFDIPSPCLKFRESVLANLPMPSKPQLHVVTAEIDKCLEGLARSDSAWSTWVSYRHKALRFCEAAQAGNEKDQYIFLHRKLAIILDKLTTQAENETQEYIKSLGRIFQKSTENAEVVTAHAQMLETMTLQLKNIVGSSLSDSARAQMAVQNGLENAKTLDHFLEALLFKMSLREQELSQAYESSFRAATEVITHDVAQVTQVLRAISANSLSLQAQLAMKNLQGIASVVLERQISQDGLLESALNKTSNILSVLDAATLTVDALQKPLLELGTTSWWPYVICPVASLTLGSYGLQPSLARNLALLGLGEFTGLLLSLASSLLRNHDAESQILSSSIPWKNWHLRHVTSEDHNSTTNGMSKQ